MLSSQTHVLRDRLRRIDGRGYRAYRDLEGSYAFDRFTLTIDHIQADPYAPPSRLRVEMPASETAYPPEWIANHARRVALADFLARSFAAALDRLNTRALQIDAGGQVVLERTAAEVRDGGAELRFTARLPAAGRTILGREAAEILLDLLPRAVLASMPADALAADSVWRHLTAIEDAQALRTALAPQGLVAFVADGAVLPRLSGASDLPLRERVIEFNSPPELRVTLPAPHADSVTGMGIPAGTTLIVGGGYHGKTTLLQAIQVGVYDHIPGDGRERVVTVADAVKVRAEDGRSVAGVDISPFLRGLPSGADTACFSTADASGSTSQAAGIMEALEVGTTLLLLDEDTSATNFLARDALMRRLIPPAMEPITPFINRLPELRARGISTILVSGGDGEYFGVADRVILMERYRPRDVTAEARRIAAESGVGPHQPGTPFRPPIPRAPVPASLSADTGRGREKVGARDRDEIRFGREEIDLATIDQLIDRSQTRAIGQILLHLVAAGLIDGRRPLAEALDALEAEIDRDGLGVVTQRRFRAPPGDLARPRRHEIAAALNRLRTLRVRQVSRS